MGFDGGFQLIVLLGRIHYFCFVCVERTGLLLLGEGDLFSLFFSFSFLPMWWAPHRVGTREITPRRFPVWILDGVPRGLYTDIFLRVKSLMKKMNSLLLFYFNKMNYFATKITKAYFFLQFHLACVARCRSLQP